MPLEQVQFQPNIPQVLTLKYDEPKPCKNNSAMISFVDDRVIFLDPADAEQFRGFGFRKGDAVAFTRIAEMNGNRIARTKWDFRPAEMAAEPAPPRAAKPLSGPVQHSVPDRNNGQCITSAPRNGNGHATHNGVAYWNGPAELLACYLEALDLAPQIEAAAAERGRAFKVNDEKVGAIASTLFISRDYRARQLGGLR